METPLTTRQTKLPEPKTATEPPTRPPFPPFTHETAIQKVRLAEDVWNSRDPEKVALAYTTDSRWRNRAEFPNGRQEIIQFLKRKWAKELEARKKWRSKDPPTHNATARPVSGYQRAERIRLNILPAQFALIHTSVRPDIACFVWRWAG